MLFKRCPLLELKAEIMILNDYKRSLKYNAPMLKAPYMDNPNPLIELINFISEEDRIQKELQNARR